MKNKVQEGDILTLAAPYAVASGAGALIGAIFGVAQTTIANGATGAFHTEGVFTLAKTSAQAWTVGARVYWDDTNKVVTTTASGNTLIGVAMAAAVNPSSTGVVRLNGSF
jgi:predicted RecA/RadA family phage recombinase